MVQVEWEATVQYMQQESAPHEEQGVVQLEKRVAVHGQKATIQSGRRVAVQLERWVTSIAQRYEKLK